jgi:hypothetical protein
VAVTNSLAIKNLAIALEALSRIHGVATAYYRVESLLDQEINQATLENGEPRTPPSPTPVNLDDDIPF